MTTPLKRKAVELATSSAKKPKANASITSFFSSPSAPATNTKTAEIPASTASDIASSPSSSIPAGEEKSAESAPEARKDAIDSGATSTAPSATATSGDSAPKPALTATAAAPLFNAAFSKAGATSAMPSLMSAKNFDKAKWTATLTNEQKDLLGLEIDTLDETWLAHLKDIITSKDFLKLKTFLKSEHTGGQKIFPPAPDVYSWSRHTPLSNVKVVILGQDPYHNDNQAHGLCFSVRAPTPAPPSLLNIYKLLKSEYPTFQPPPNRGGLLTPWADRGVLLLNTCLTVRAHQAASHAGKGWEAFTQKVIDTVAKQRSKGVVFLAWGKPAQTKIKGVDRRKHLVLESVHPSPLSAARGFFDCAHFSKTNAWLAERYGSEGVIDWNLNVKPEDAGV